MLNSNRGHIFNLLQLHHNSKISIFLDINQSVRQTSIILFHEDKLYQNITELLLW